MTIKDINLIICILTVTLVTAIMIFIFLMAQNQGNIKGTCREDFINHVKLNNSNIFCKNYYESKIRIEKKLNNLNKKLNKVNKETKEINNSL